MLRPKNENTSKANSKLINKYTLNLLCLRNSPINKQDKGKTKMWKYAGNARNWYSGDNFVGMGPKVTLKNRIGISEIE